jgi:hypothetical protein
VQLIKLAFRKTRSANWEVGADCPYGEAVSHTGVQGPIGEAVVALNDQVRTNWGQLLGHISTAHLVRRNASLALANALDAAGGAERVHGATPARVCGRWCERVFGRVAVRSSRLTVARSARAGRMEEEVLDLLFCMSHARVRSNSGAGVQACLLAVCHVRAEH